MENPKLVLEQGKAEIVVLYIRLDPGDLTDGLNVGLGYADVGEGSAHVLLKVITLTLKSLVSKI